MLQSLLFRALSTEPLLCVRPALGYGAMVCMGPAQFSRSKVQVGV